MKLNRKWITFFAVCLGLLVIISFGFVLPAASMFGKEARTAYAIQHTPGALTPKKFGELKVNQTCKTQNATITNEGMNPDGSINVSIVNHTENTSETKPIVSHDGAFVDMYTFMNMDGVLEVWGSEADASPSCAFSK